MIAEVRNATHVLPTVGNFVLITLGMFYSVMLGSLIVWCVSYVAIGSAN